MVVLVGENIIFWVVIFPFLLSALNVTRENPSDPAFVVSRSGKLFLLLGPHMLLSLFVSLIAEGSMHGIASLDEDHVSSDVAGGHHESLSISLRRLDCMMNWIISEN
jgi:hypothetical protein